MMCMRYSKASGNEQSEAKRRMEGSRKISQTKREIVDLASTLSKRRARGGGGM